MTYPTKLLNDNERLVLDLTPHWWFFVETIAALAVSVVFGIVAVGAGWPSAVQTLAGVAVVGCVVWMLVRYAKWRTTNFVVTSDRVIFRQGVFAKHGNEIPLERINSVHFDQGIIERIVGAGDLIIESGADEGRSNFTDVRNPDHVTNTIHKEMNTNEDRMYRGHQPGVQAPDPGDVTSQLEKLEGLMQRGSLTPDEFEAQKRKLLD